MTLQTIPSTIPLQLSTQDKLINAKWILPILIILYDKKLHSYRAIRKSGIPNSTLTIKLNNLVKYKWVEKFIYGNPTSLHYTDYKITSLGSNYLDSILPDSVN